MGTRFQTVSSIHNVSYLVNVDHVAAFKFSYPSGGSKVAAVLYVNGVGQGGEALQIVVDDEVAEEIVLWLESQ